MAGRSLNIDINTNDQQTLAAIKRLQREFKGLDGSIDKTSKRGSTLGRDLVGGLALVAGVKFATNEWEEAEQQARSTEAVIKSTGNAAHVSAKQQEELVTQLSRMAGIDDEVVNGGANMLRTFSQIKGENFGKALGASLNYAAFKGQDLATSAEMVGKALNNPLTGMTKLTKAGVVFSDQQKQQIRDFMAVGDVANAQKVILDELGAEYGGQAKAMATDSGKMKVAMGDAAESAGKALAPSLAIAADAAAGAAEVFSHIPAPLQATAFGLLGVAYAGPKVVEATHKIGDGLGAVRRGLQLIPEKAVGAQSGMAKVVTSMGGAEGASIAAAGALGVVGLAAIGFADKARVAADNAASLKAATAELGSIAESTGKSIDEAFSEDFLLNAAKSAPEAVRDLQAAGSSLSEFRDAALGSDKAFRTYLDGLDGSGPRFDAMKGALAQSREALVAARDAAKTGAEAQKELADKTEKTAAADKNWLGVNEQQVRTTWERVDAVRAANDEAQRSMDLALAATSADLALASAHDAVQDAQIALADARRDGSVEQQQRAEDDLTGAILREVQAADDLARKNAEVSGKHYEAGDSAKVQQTRLFELMGQTGLTNDTLKTLYNRLRDAAVKRKVAIDTAEADAAAESLLRKLERIQNLTGSLGSQQANGQPVRPGAINAERQAGGDAPRRRTGGDAAVVITGPVTIRPGDRQIAQAERDEQRKRGRRLRAA